MNKNKNQIHDPNPDGKDMRAQKEKCNNQEGRHAGLPLRRGVPMRAPCIVVVGMYGQGRPSPPSNTLAQRYGATIKQVLISIREDPE